MVDLSWFELQTHRAYSCTCIWADTPQLSLWHSPSECPHIVGEGSQVSGKRQQWPCAVPCRRWYAPTRSRRKASLSQLRMLGGAPTAGKKKTGQAKTTPIGFDLTNSLVVYQAAQDCRQHDPAVAGQLHSKTATPRSLAHRVDIAHSKFPILA